MMTVISADCGRSDTFTIAKKRIKMPNGVFIIGNVIVFIIERISVSEGWKLL